MNHNAFVISLGFGVLALTAQHAFSQTAQNCSPRHAVLDRLKAHWGETRRSIMLSHNEHLFEIFAADDTGTWTILQTLPNGVSCVMAAGVDYESLLLEDTEGAPA